MGPNTYYKGSDGEWYAKVQENRFECSESSLSKYKYTDETTAKLSSENSYRYFKVEPVKWKVITKDYNNTKKSLLHAAEIYTSNIPYFGYTNSNNTRSVGTDTKIYPNNYKYSQIRAYLNGLVYYEDTNSKATWTYHSEGFLQTAFTTSAQSKIETTLVDNSAESTQDEKEELEKATAYACDNTKDKLFLLSEKEITTKAYNFDDVYNRTDNNRKRAPTDYTLANNFNLTYKGDGEYFLRSPRNSYSYFVCEGCSVAMYSSQASYPSYGVAPALTISLPEN